MKIKSLKENLFILASALLVGSFANSDTQIPVSIDNQNYRPLGAGYDSRKQLFRGDCVEASEPLTMNLSSGKVNLKLEASQESLANKLGISAAGRYRSGVTTTSASAEFLNQSQANAFSISYNYIAESQYREYIENKASSPIVARPGIDPYTKDSRVFFENCGDEFVYARDKAARLFVNMKISFVSKAERNRFAASFGIDSPATSFAAQLESDSSKYSSSNQIAISILQIGGDPSKIGRLMCPTNADGKPDDECQSNSRKIVNCSFGDIKPCLDVIANAIAYANAQDGENFPSQIRNGQNYSVNALYTRPFVYIGAQFPPVPLRTSEDNFQAEVASLTEIFDAQRYLWNYAFQLYKGRAPRLSDRQRTEMEGLQDHFYRKMLKSKEALEKCYDEGFTVCSNQLRETKEFVGFGLPSQKSVADIEALTSAETFAQYCDLATSENPEIATTINSLGRYLEDTKQIEPMELKRGDICFKLGEKMMGLRTLELSSSSYPIIHLGPISVLGNLEKLNLSNKAIANAESLRNLSHLQELVLDNNLISDVGFALDIRRLQKISLKNNKILSLEELGKIPALNYIDARGNSKSLKCPLIQESKCKLLDFSDSLNQVSNAERCDSRVGHASVAIGPDAVLVTGGVSSDGLSPFKNTMEIRTKDGCKLMPQKMLESRGGHTITKLQDNRILIVGGRTDTVEILDSNFNSALLNQKMKSRRTQHTSTLLKDGRVLIVGGYTDDYDGRKRSSNVSSSVELFDPKSESIKNIANLLVPRAEHTATLLGDGRVLILGGFSNTKAIDIAEVFDPNTNQLSEVDESMQIGRFGHAASLLDDGRVLIIGGYRWNQAPVEGKTENFIEAMGKIEIFDPKDESFRVIDDSLDQARGGLEAITMFDGRVLMIGGETQGQVFQDLSFPGSSSNLIEIFDPASEGVYSIGRLSESRFRFSATAIGKKRVLLVGGAGGSASSISSELLVYKSIR